MVGGLAGHALALEEVHHVFGATTALDGVSLSIAPGELIGLLGPSGCGKTTLLRAIAGFIRPTAGDVLVDGVRINDVPANRRNVGIVFQNYALFPHLSVAENVAYGLKCRRTKSAVVAKRTAEMLSLVKMSDFKKRLPGQLSGGQQQRVALARALAIEPKIVLLDEPFSALDKNLRLDMQIEIKGLLKAYGLTSIIVTHDQEEALSMSDRIVVLNRGRVEQVDTPGRLYSRPANLFVNRFVGYTNLIDAVVVGAADGRATIDAGHGAVFEVANPGNFGPGRAVMVSIRPENLAIADAGHAGAFPATVHLTLPLGPTEIVEARMGGGKAVKLTRPHAPSSKPLSPGEAIRLAVADPAGVAVFAAADGPLPRGGGAAREQEG
jgi:putative spermidine/putrescine transport system ATP-binding protein